VQLTPEQKARQRHHSQQLKEVRMRPKTDVHDLDYKVKHARAFLEEGNRVQFTIMFRGREMAHRNIGMRMMERLIEEVSEFSQVEARPRQEGPNLTAILAPKKAAGKGAAAAPRPARIAPAAPVGAKSAAASVAAEAPRRSDSSGSSGG
jgi:translation initiation factor IF-3